MFISHVSPFFHDICHDLYDCCHQQTAGICNRTSNVSAFECTLLVNQLNNFSDIFAAFQFKIRFRESCRAKRQLRTLESTVAFTAPHGFSENY